MRIAFIGYVLFISFVSSSSAGTDDSCANERAPIFRDTNVTYRARSIAPTWAQNTRIPRDRVFLVYSSANMNQSASMLGHTMLVFSDKDFSLTSAMAVSYSAYLTTENPLLFAVKGLFGLLPGIYTCVPFHDRLKEYSVCQYRDLWAYELKVDRAQIERMIDFIGRQSIVTGRYSFVTANCSTLLLPVAGAAQDRQEQWLKFPRFYVVPLEVLRWGYQNQLIVSNAVFFPSQLRSLRISGAEVPQKMRREIVRQIRTMADNPDNTVNGTGWTGQAQRLAIDYAEFLRDHYQMETNAYRKLLCSYMSKTNGLPATTPYHGATPDILERPPPAKASVGVVCRRTRQDRSVRGVMSIRPASHALLDPRDDLAGNSTVEALALSLEYTSHAVWLKDFRLVAIESLPVRDEFYQPLSWRLSMGYGADKYRVIAGDKSAGDVDFGFGMTHSFLGPFLGYVMVIGRAGFADAFDAGYALGPGAAIGTIWPWGKRFRAMAEVNATRFYAGDAAFISEVKIEVSQRTGKRSSLDLLARTQSSADAHVTELIAKINYYF